jgi:hypothetical protein
VAPSSAHWKLEPLSFAVKATEALVLALGSGGAWVMVVVGASVSITKVTAALRPTLPASSRCSACAV